MICSIKEVCQCDAQLHVHKDHEAPAEPSNQQHGDVDTIDEEFIEQAEVQAAAAQEQQDNGELVLAPQEDPDAYILQA